MSLAYRHDSGVTSPLSRGEQVRSLVALVEDRDRFCMDRGQIKKPKQAAHASRHNRYFGNRGAFD